jgi:hypothetical protein
MPGPLVRDPSEPSPQHHDFGRARREDVAAYLGVMQVLHTEPAASAFTRLLRKRLKDDDYVLLAHIFEEVSVLALHRLLPESLLFDAFAFDMYWDELREDILDLRTTTGNGKLCENFESAAERARLYRRDFPPKGRWDDFGGGRRRPHPGPDDEPDSAEDLPDPQIAGGGEWQI